MISVTNISKTFRVPVPVEGRWAAARALFSRARTDKEAVRDISFTIERGEFVGYIGPNGAGKSTTIKMLTGILHPTRGEVRVAGLSPHKHRTDVARRIGAVFGQRSQLWWDLPVRDSYDILAAMYKVPDRDKRERLARLTELLELDEFLLTPVRKLSLGQRMRADLAAALLHAPDVLFLDEPTIGLDVVAKKRIRTFLQALNRDFGVTVLLTTHDMDDIEQLCRRVMVINRGELAYDGSIEALRERIGLPTTVKVTFGGSFSVPDRWEEPFRLAERGDDYVTLECNRSLISTMEVLRAAGAWGDIADVHMEEPDFEDIIHRIY
ncbi:ABC transporter ATP-binding protein [Gordoniibacillus kamchatkensis]|uniref:ABC transporter ATP-binding protein n=1 Tax=Gordoniibacillus kamchatkensis TaxID=1590651 RepID=A0ABR5AE77_9BACL|nr:ATP-binding cassette domain-containing protein [Paenibacillus sp. VKM B-2647]KIL39276.1 ABC transporter ATP-binding protein [Paenibacillus sp. VKM B-2647]